MSLEFVLFGVDSVFTAEIAETLKRLGATVVAEVLTGEPEWDLRGVTNPVKETDIDKKLLSLPVVLPWVTPALRRDRWQRAQKAGFTRFEPVVDPMAVLASTVSIADGAYVNAAATVGAYAVLGQSASINRNASVGHHTALDEFVSIGPGATIAARCKIGRGVMVGSGAAVAPGLHIGKNSVIGLGSAVIRDVPENTMVAGSPAKVIKSRPPE